MLKGEKVNSCLSGDSQLFRVTWLMQLQENKKKNKNQFKAEMISGIMTLPPSRGRRKFQITLYSDKPLWCVYYGYLNITSIEAIFPKGIL